MLRSTFVVAGWLAWVGAITFASNPTTKVRGPVNVPAGSNTSVLQDYEVVNPAAAAAGGGFAVAGGLCFLAAALSNRNRRPGAPESAD